ncbi:MAG TPA: sodium:proton antiporter NhaD [Parafilimonas sp.]|nr:sodium:proton antiporter NhaD [Parafilimonas sp.]
MIGLIITIFTVGYLSIALEHTIKINKAATALITGIVCWTVYILYTPDKEMVGEQLSHHLSELSGILFFLLGAMTIVELADLFNGFDIITARITQINKLKLLWIISFITFFLSAVLDNLTTTIVILSLTAKLIKGEKDRLFFAGMTVIAANAGGAWSPIGDISTTMLWIGGQITSFNIVTASILPSLVCMLAPLIFMSFKMKGDVERPLESNRDSSIYIPKKQQYIIFFCSVLVLVMVPVFKTLTHLPPYMGILLGLSVLWIITEIIRRAGNNKEKDVLSVSYALRKIDTPSILFFLGILLSVAALEATGMLAGLSNWLSDTVKNEKIIVISIGLISAVVDNVPLVAAAQGMYDLSQYPTDHLFWSFMAFCTGTGGSALIIGSAAGVVAMGMEKISFFWYLKKISLLALLGYFAGVVAFLLQHYLSGGLGN